MWQFIKGTGLRYGLAIDGYVDERRDPEKATRAAAKYLLDLYKQFGSWYLAAASYNCGEGRVQRELDQSKHKNFWELSANMCLPTETKNYVPQMIAATIIAKNPEKFGFKNVPYQPPMKIDKVQVNEPTSLKAAAFAVNMQADDIQALNPELLRGVTPPDSPNYALNLPPNSKELFTKNITLARIENPAVASRPVQTARSNSRQYSHSRSQAAHQAAGAPATPKAAAKPKTYAKGSQKASAGAAYAKKGKAPEAKEAPSAVQACLFGGVAAAPKHGAANKAKGIPSLRPTARPRASRQVPRPPTKRATRPVRPPPRPRPPRRAGLRPEKSKDKIFQGQIHGLFAAKAQ